MEGRRAGRRCCRAGSGGRCSMTPSWMRSRRRSRRPTRRPWSAEALVRASARRGAGRARPACTRPSPAMPHALRSARQPARRRLAQQLDRTATTVGARRRLGARTCGAACAATSSRAVAPGAGEHRRARRDATLSAQATARAGLLAAAGAATRRSTLLRETADASHEALAAAARSNQLRGRRVVSRADVAAGRDAAEVDAGAADRRAGGARRATSTRSRCSSAGRRRNSRSRRGRSRAVFRRHSASPCPRRCWSGGPTSPPRSGAWPPPTRRSASREAAFYPVAVPRRRPAASRARRSAAC